MKKPVTRQTKKEREQRQRDDLYRRVCDIMAGACQGDDPEADLWVGANMLPAIVRGVELRLLPKDYKDKHAYLTSIHNADSYDNALKLTDFLFEHGIRA